MAEVRVKLMRATNEAEVEAIGEFFGRHGQVVCYPEECGMVAAAVAVEGDRDGAYDPRDRIVGAFTMGVAKVQDVTALAGGKVAYELEPRVGLAVIGETNSTLETIWAFGDKVESLRNLAAGLQRMEMRPDIASLAGIQAVAEATIIVDLNTFTEVE